MSGALLAWMLVMINVLMSLTFFQLTVMPCFFASGYQHLLEAVDHGLVDAGQMVTVLLSELLLPPPPQPARAVAATTQSSRPSPSCGLRLDNRMRCSSDRVPQIDLRTVLEITTERNQQIIAGRLTSVKDNMPARPRDVWVTIGTRPPGPSGKGWSACAKRRGRRRTTLSDVAARGRVSVDHGVVHPQQPLGGDAHQRHDPAGRVRQQPRPTCRTGRTAAPATCARRARPRSASSPTRWRRGPTRRRCSPAPRPPPAGTGTCS